MAPKTIAQRVADLRARRKAQGLMRMELFVHPEDHEAIRAYAARLQRKRSKEVTPKA